MYVQVAQDLRDIRMAQRAYRGAWRQRLVFQTALLLAAFATSGDLSDPQYLSL